MSTSITEKLVRLSKNIVKVENVTFSKKEFSYGGINHPNDCMCASCFYNKPQATGRLVYDNVSREKVNTRLLKKIEESLSSLLYFTYEQLKTLEKNCDNRSSSVRILLKRRLEIYNGFDLQGSNLIFLEKKPRRTFFGIEIGDEF